MSDLPTLAVATDDCWNRIGIAGDRSCPELETHVHCRNCPVFSAAARAFFDRPAPEGYLAEWARALAAAPEEADGRDGVSLLIFRLHGEWLALATSAVGEVAAPRPVHRIPHRSDDVLIGLVNLRGQLQLCVSLHGLLGIDPPPEGPVPAEGTQAPRARLVVIGRGSESWAFPADEVPGVRRIPRSQLRAVPATLGNPTTSFSQAVFTWRERSVGLLDEQRLLASLRSPGR